MKITFVTPWYGPGIPGGAEALAREVAQRLAAAGHQVSVLSTTIRDFYASWDENYHAPGSEVIAGVQVHRFPVSATRRAAFDAVNARLMAGAPVNATDSLIYVNEMFSVPGLYHALAAEPATTRLVFLPYMFATTYFGVQIRPEHSLLVPCLHDEAYARLPIYRNVFSSVRARIFNSHAEQELAHEIFGQREGQQERVAGMGIEKPENVDGARFRQRYHIEGPFVLYAGRLEPGKNSTLLLDFWSRYTSSRDNPAELVLIGSTTPGLARHIASGLPGVRALGFIPEADKWDAYAAATALVQPSLHESFSIVLLECWATGRPVLVHGRCAVTREHVRRANGGLYFVSYEEFAAVLDLLLAQPELAAQLGAQGRRYVDDYFRWEEVLAHYEQLLSSF